MQGQSLEGNPVNEQECIPPSTLDASQSLREKLATACRILGTEGHNDIVYGHMSARVPSTTRFWLKGGGLGLEEITPTDLVELDLDGRVLAGTRARHLEYPIHSEIYRRRADVVAVVHTHPLYATVFGAILSDLRALTHEGTFFVPPPIPKFDLTSDLILTPELGAAVAQALGAHHTLFLVNHGIVVVGQSIEAACVAALLLEKACRAQAIAQAAGAFAWTSDDEALRKRAHIYTPRAIQQIWDYYCRKLQGVGS
jgi:ribulose-5-phosphate 4-epimerase/fuculose-1-phosphate aldolase